MNVSIVTFANRLRIEGNALEGDLGAAIKQYDNGDRAVEPPGPRCVGGASFPCRQRATTALAGTLSKRTDRTGTE